MGSRYSERGGNEGKRSKEKINLNRFEKETEM